MGMGDCVPKVDIFAKSHVMLFMDVAYLNTLVNLAGRYPTKYLEVCLLIRRLQLYIDTCDENCCAAHRTPPSSPRLDMWGSRVVIIM